MPGGSDDSFQNRTGPFPFTSALSAKTLVKGDAQPPS
jgi:hypothetical protein